MDDRVFTAGVKPGGLTSATEIRILLCYLLSSVPSPLTREEMDAALIGEELVNYFEYATALTQLAEKGLVVCEDGRYTITEEGRAAGHTLERELPFSVREQAVRAAVAAQQFSQKKHQNRATVQQMENGHYMVCCEIWDGEETIFSTSLLMPDTLTAEQVRARFVDNGEDIFRTMLLCLTDFPLFQN